MKHYLLIPVLLVFFSAQAQQVNQQIKKGNDSYKEKKFQQANDAYAQALKKDDKNTVANFNSGNALHRLNKPEDAAKAYGTAAATATDPLIKAQAFNNQGLALIKQKKLTDAIEAFKTSVRVNSNDKECRENLPKALNELKKQQQKNDQQDQNKKNQDQKDSPQKNKSKMSEAQAEKLLKSLQQEEKEKQKELQKKSRKDRQLKDW